MHLLISKEQASFNFMAAVTICSDFGAQESSLSLFPFPPPPSICHEVMGQNAMILVFSECGVLSQLFQSPLSPSSRGSLVPLHFLPLNGIIYIFEVVDISPDNLDSSL